MKPGDRVGRYVLHELIGEGQLAQVFKAEKSGFGGHVALKILKKDATRDHQFAERFINDARFASSFNHQNIVRILDAEDSDVYPFIVMDLIEGRPLSNILSSQTLNVRTALSIGRDVARALKVIHAAGVVHRDVKPSNVIVDEQIPSAKLTDFSAAKNLCSDGIDLTIIGQLVGTPRYMAPEYIIGGQVDGRSDLCALGATLFEAISGRAAFEGATIEEVFRSLLDLPVPDLCELRPDVPKAVAIYIARLLSKAPEARPPSADQVVKDLERLIHGDAIYTTRAPVEDPEIGRAVVAAYPRQPRPLTFIRSRRCVHSLMLLVTLLFLMLSANWLAPIMQSRDHVLAAVARSSHFEGRGSPREVVELTPLVLVVLQLRFSTEEGTLRAGEMIGLNAEVDYQDVSMLILLWGMLMIILWGFVLIPEVVEAKLDNAEFYRKELDEIQRTAMYFRASSNFMLFIGLAVSFGGFAAAIWVFERQEWQQAVLSAGLLASVQTMAALFLKQYWALRADYKEFARLRIERAERYQAFIEMQGDRLDPARTAVMTRA